MSTKHGRRGQGVTLYSLDNRSPFGDGLWTHSAVSAYGAVKPCPLLELEGVMLYFTFLIGPCARWLYILFNFWKILYLTFLVSWASWVTVVLQCYDTVGWVIWPIKLSPKWPVTCWVGPYCTVCPGGRCNEDEMNMLVPIVVGACLAGLIVIVLIAYFIGRHQSKRGYENVWRTCSP